MVVLHLANGTRLRVPGAQALDWRDGMLVCGVGRGELSFAPLEVESFEVLTDGERQPRGRGAVTPSGFFGRLRRLLRPGAARRRARTAYLRAMIHERVEDLLKPGAASYLIRSEEGDMPLDEWVRIVAGKHYGELPPEEAHEAPHAANESQAEADRLGEQSIDALVRLWSGAAIHDAPSPEKPDTA